ncbi:MAG: cytochrome c biogenesis protein CcsA [Bacteroidia bacterium]|nr:cytochrome c biogenesis protein CcsA [Bacteroidia bacterium]MBT8279678.1 cytochrome c biogenesis protein CcsA [Bacteroidia bacterium]NND25486.1 cytochrome c biogenesis protein CcsA [Flavobacteriaceae bacterium]
MQKKIANILFSTRLTALLFIAFAAAMIIGTFLDAGQDTSPTPYTRNMIYNAWWFEAIMGMFVVNFVGNIFRFRLYKKEKWATLTLHLAFIFILLGAFVTRYIGYEGIMAIREGATEKTFLSDKTYLTTYIDGSFEIDGKVQRRVRFDEVDFSPRMENHFKVRTDYNKIPISIELVDFIAGAEEDIVPDEEGDNYLKIVEAGSGAPHNHFLKEGQIENIHNVLYALNKYTEGAVNISFTDSTLTIESPFQGEYMTMATGQQGILVKDSIQPLALRSRYVIGNQTLVFPKPVVKGKFDIVKKSELLKSDEDAVILHVRAGDAFEEVKLLGGKGSNNAFKQVKIGGLDFAFKYGSKVLELPFSIKLNDFIAERYPGTENSYSSYESKVTVFDEEAGDFDFHIYMNNILNHGGYKFFQASFDPDEKGTILSVNHDAWGTRITYLGYFLLYFGLMAILFAKNTRFDDLRNYLKKVKAKKAALTAVVLLFSLGLTAQTESHSRNLPSKQQVDSILSVHITSEAEAAKLGRLVIQDFDGRMKPINTYASELLRKLSKYDSYEGFNADQIFLSMQESPILWYNVPIIYLKAKKADTIRNLIGIDKSRKYATLADFFTGNGSYKLGPYLEDAYKTQVPTAIQKEFKETDQRVNLLYNTIEGRSLKLFPIPNDDNNTWVSPIEYREGNYKLEDSLYGNFINTGFNAYLINLNNAKSSGDYSEADKLLDAIKRTQEKLGSEVMLSDEKVNAEILYNKYDIFKKLFSWYMYAGTLMFIMLIIQIFNDRSKYVNGVVKFFQVIIVGLFVLHTAGLIARWYISGHAPWSDAYESMIYVAWATMLFGLLFGRKSALTMASTAFVVAMILMIAHWNWMDPSIANLQPVLNSYWLMIHVAVIVGSYGPFALGMILGTVVLILMILTNSKNKAKMDLNIKELTTVNEMALTVGLVMLTIGNFLGGMWANESWGRYWGWDPKETWALISIMMYAFVIHMRLIPGLRGRWWFNLSSIWCFSFIIFTYFGVNFYLSGLHSYQSGQQIASVNIIAIAAVVIALLGFFSYRKYKKFYKK